MIPSIVRGEDAFFKTKLRKPNGDPYSLDGWTKITMKFRTAKGFLEITTDEVAAIAATVDSGAITFTAGTPGEIGNSIALVFDGNDTIQEVVDAWNTANPTNTVAFTGDDGTTVLTAQTLTLVEGRDAYYPIEVITPSELGFMDITLLESDTNELKTGKRLTAYVVIDKGNHPSGERRKVNIPDAYNVEAGP